MSIASEITRLQDAKSSIKTAIEGKGVEVPSTTKLDGYGELISSIPSGGGDEFYASLVSSIEEHTLQFEVVDPMVETHWKLGATDFSIIDGVASDASIAIDGNVVTQECLSHYGYFVRGTGFADNVTKIIKLPSSIFNARENMFLNCTALADIVTPILVIDSMASFFSDSNALRNVSVRFISTGKPTGNITLYKAYSGCSALESLDCSHFSTYNVTNIERTFDGCASLKTLDISSFDTHRVTSMGRVFDGCTALETLKLGEGFFKSTSVTSISISSSPNWTHDSMIESLYTNQLNRDTTNAKTVTLHATAKARLSDTEKANIAALGITIA